MQYFAIIVHIAILDSCGRGHISGIYPESIKVGVGGSTSSYIYIYTWTLLSAYYWNAHEGGDFRYTLDIALSKIMLA